MDLKFYECAICGQIIAVVKESGADIVCCGEVMKEIVPCTTDGAVEKHLPLLKQQGNDLVVEVGSLPHPMSDSHYIEWIALQTKEGNQRKCLKPGQEPRACFRICDGDEVIAVYAYCNLHALWKSSGD